MHRSDSRQGGWGTDDERENLVCAVVSYKCSGVWACREGWGEGPLQALWAV